MSDWRDDLPPIPAERIRDRAVREGTRRREDRRRRQRVGLFGGIGLAAVALIVAAGVLTRPDDGGDSASEATVTPADTAATAVTPPSGTAAASATTSAAAASRITDAAAATVGAEATAAEDTTAGTAPPGDTGTVPYTIAGGTIGSLAPSDEVTVGPVLLWELPASGPGCGPAMLEVMFAPLAPLHSPVVHWQVSDIGGEADMVIEGAVARATIGPFPAETIARDVRHEILVYVTDLDAAGGQQVFRTPTVVLSDCSP